MYTVGVNEFVKSHPYRIYPRAMFVSVIDNTLETVKYGLVALESIAVLVINLLGVVLSTIGDKTAFGFELKHYNIDDMIFCEETLLTSIAQIAIRAPVFFFKCVYQSLKIMYKPLEVRSINFNPLIANEESSITEEDVQQNSGLRNNNVVTNGHDVTPTRLNFDDMSTSASDGSGGVTTPESTSSDLSVGGSGKTNTSGYISDCSDIEDGDSPDVGKTVKNVRRLWGGSSRRGSRKTHSRKPQSKKIPQQK